MADGTSNASIGAKRWKAFNDDATPFTGVTVTVDNAVTLPMVFPHPARINRLAFVASTAISSATPVVVEVYKNTSTLLGTWTVSGANVAVAANNVAIVNLALADADGTTNSDGSITFFGATQYDLEAGEWIHLKVTEPAATTGIGVFWVEYLEKGVHGTRSTNVTVQGTWA